MAAPAGAWHFAAFRGEVWRSAGVSYFAAVPDTFDLLSARGSMISALEWALNRSRAKGKCSVYSIHGKEIRRKFTVYSIPGWKCGNR